MMVTSDDEIRTRSQIEIPTGVRIRCEPMADGHHLLSVGGSVLDGPRLVLDLGPGAADAFLTAVRSALIK